MPDDATAVTTRLDMCRYNDREGHEVRQNRRQFDFDGDGTAGTIFDALRLYAEVS